jgi:hypothetical protein
MDYYNWNEFKNDPIVKRLSEQQKWIMFNDRINEMAVAAAAAAGAAGAGGRKHRQSSAIEITSLHIQNAPRIFYSGEMLQLIVLNQDDVNVTHMCTSFTSSAENLATVDENGLITITVTEGDGGDLVIEASYNSITTSYLSVVHYEKIEEITSVPSTYPQIDLGYISFNTLITGSTEQLLILDQNSIDVTSECTFESDDTDIITVSSNGLVSIVYDETVTRSNNTVNVTATYGLLTTIITFYVDIQNCAIYAGSDQSINVSDTLILSGSTVGVLKSGVYPVWEQMSGNQVTITNSGSSVTTVTGVDVGDYIFRYGCTCRNRIAIYDQVFVHVTSTENQFTIVVNDDYFSFNSVDESWIGLTINWGDGSPELTVSDIGEINHTYSSIDTYVIIG